MAILIDQDFEDPSVGYDDNNAEGWAVGTDGEGSGWIFDPKYAVDPLRGSQSLRVKDGTVPTWDGAYFTSTAAIYGFFMFKLVDAPGVNYSDILTTWDSGLTQQVVISMNTNRKLQISWLGSGNSAETPALEIGTTYYIWFYFSKGTGSNAQAWIKIGTAPYIPGSNDAEVTSGSWTANREWVGFTTMHDSGYEYIVDRLIVSTTAIGNVEAATAALTGTATDSITEADIIAGGKTIILTLTGDTWIPSS